MALAGCSAPSGPAGTVSAPGYPPSDTAALIRHLQPLVEPFGLEMTRASLIDLDADYSPSPTGRHLALYARPRGQFPPQRYVDNLVPLTAVLVDVFHRWPELESFDICQETPDAPTLPPPAVTRVNVPRDDAMSIDWETIDLEGLIAQALIRYGNTDSTGLQVEVRDPANRQPTYLRALRGARRLAADARGTA